MFFLTCSLSILSKINLTQFETHTNAAILYFQFYPRSTRRWRRWYYARWRASFNSIQDQQNVESHLVPPRECYLSILSKINGLSDDNVHPEVIFIFQFYPRSTWLFEWTRKIALITFNSIQDQRNFSSPFEYP